MNDPIIPSLKTAEITKTNWTVVRPMPTFINKLICKVRGHVVNDGEYIDSHGNDDALSFCERCGELDV
jgi:hypothetical protein